MQKRSSRKNFQARLEEMIECLRDEIRNGALTVGSFLPSEKDLEKRFKLGNSSIRKGLAVLVSEGWIEKIPRVGNRVINIGSEEKTIIKFGYSSRFPQLIELEQIIEKFHQEYPTIHVQLLELPLSEYSFSLKSYLEAGVLDVVMLSNNNFQYFIDTSNTEMLENVSMNEEMFPFLNQAFQHEGCLLAQPFIFSPVILCYNREHFRQAEVSEPDSSWTWHDLLNAAQQVAMKNHTYGFYYHLPSRNRWPIFMLQSGMKLVPDEHGKYKVKGTKLVEGLTICRDMILNPDVFPILITENEADVEALFLEEKVSVIMTTYFYLNAFKDSGLTFDVSPIPTFENSDTLLITIGLAINKRSVVKEKAKQFVDYMTSYQTQLHIRQHTLTLPAMRKATEWEGQESIYRPSRYFMFREIVPTYKQITELGLNNKQFIDIQLEIMLYVSGVHDIGAFCSRLEEILSNIEER